MGRVHVALVHYPVRDREGGTITSAITNLDVHDLARSCRTYGVSGFWVTTPIAAQHAIVDQILSHWKDGPGAQRTPERTKALARCTVVGFVADAISEIEKIEGRAPYVIATGAKDYGRATISFPEAGRAIEGAERPTLLLFGTAHGLAPSVVGNADAILAPIQPNADYNFLSVRAACGVVLDRLFGERGDS